MLLIVTACLTWGPVALACERFFSHTGFTECRNKLIKKGECDSQCANERACEPCKCYAINIAQSQPGGAAWILPAYKQNCPTRVAESEALWRTSTKAR